MDLSAKGTGQEKESRMQTSEGFLGQMWSLEKEARLGHLKSVEGLGDSLETGAEKGLTQKQQIETTPVPRQRYVRNPE